MCRYDSDVLVDCTVYAEQPTYDTHRYTKLSTESVRHSCTLCETMGSVKELCTKRTYILVYLHIYIFVHIWFNIFSISDITLPKF